jgi:DNA-directed RNA polymerase subunit K/omega
MCRVEFNEKLSSLLHDGRYKYLIVNVVAKRARQLNDGARPEVAMRGDNPMDLTRVALLETETEKLRVEPSERAGQLVDIAGIVK